MGRAPIGDTGEFARAIIDAIVELSKKAAGQAGRRIESGSNRWLSEHTTKSREYWRRAISHERPITTNDIEEAAIALGMTPWALCDYAQDATRATHRETPRSDYALAAYEEPNFQQIQEAENE